MINQNYPDQQISITISDVTAFQQHLAEIKELTAAESINADTNGDSAVEINDATYLKKHLAEYDVVLGQS